MQQLIDRTEIQKQIAAHGLKATHQRIAVYEALLQLCDKHPVAEDVHLLLKPNYPSISLGTVYKTLDTLAETGLIRRVPSEKGSNRYDADTSAHNHIYCSNTKEIIDYKDDELEALLTGFFEKRNMENFEIKSFFVQLTGNKIELDKKVSITRINR